MIYYKQGSGRVADFFKRWLLYTKQFDDIRKDSDIAYEIGEIDKVTPVTTLPPVAVNHDDTQNSKLRQNLIFRLILTLNFLFFFPVILHIFNFNLINLEIRNKINYFFIFLFIDIVFLKTSKPI